MNTRSESAINTMITMAVLEAAATLVLAITPVSDEVVLTLMAVVGVQVFSALLYWFGVRDGGKE